MNGDSESLPPPELSPRLCSLEKWPDFSGYGFNLHAKRNVAGQYIGKVDDHSPAKQATLKEGDKIVEVNGINVFNQNHHQVVTMIKESGDEVELLVVDDEAETHYKKHNLFISSSAPNVIKCCGRKNTIITTTINGDVEDVTVNGDDTVEDEEVMAVAQTVVAVESVPVRSSPSPDHQYQPEPEPEPLEEPEILPPPILDETDGYFEEEVMVQSESTRVVHAAPDLPPPQPEVTNGQPEVEENGTTAELVVEESVTVVESTTVVESAPVVESTPVVKSSPAPPPPEQVPEKKNESLSFGMSAKEYREMLKQKSSRNAGSKNAAGFKAKKDAFDQL